MTNRGQSHLIAALIFVLSAITSGLYWWQFQISSEQLREETLRQSAVRAKQVNAAVADQISMLFFNIDSALKEFIEHYVPNDGVVFQAEVRRIDENLPAEVAFQVSVADAKGYVVASKLETTERIFLGDRDYFKTHLESGKNELYISAPLFGRISKKWAIIFSRPIRRNGQFLGVAYVGVSPSYLQKTLLSLTLATDDAIAIFRESGEYLARNQDHESAMGKAAGKDRPFVGPSAINSGTLRVFSNFDKIFRLYEWQRLSDYPVTVVLGLSEETVLKAAERGIAQNRMHGQIGTAILWIFTLGLIGLVYKGARQHRALVEHASNLSLATEKLRKSEQSFAAAQMISGVGSYVLDISSEKWTSSAALDTVFGIDESFNRSVTGWQSLIHPDDRAQMAAYFTEEVLGKNQAFDREYRIIRQTDHAERWVHGLGKLEFDELGHARTMLGSIQDITDRKLGEAELERYHNHLEELVEQRTAELAKTEARATQILDSTADGLYGIDADGKITFVNSAACALLGFTPQQMQGRNSHLLFHHHYPDGKEYPATECPTCNIFQMHQAVRVDDEVFWHAEGYPIPVMYAVHQMMLEGKVAGAVISFVDITLQRAAEEAKDRAVEAAENLARMRSEFLANMSHEIRTPMNGVLGFAGIGLRNYQDSTKARHAFEQIQESGLRLLGIINDILDLSKIEAGKLNIEQTNTDLVSVVQQSVDIIHERIKTKRLKVHVKLAPDMPRYFKSDPLRIGQVLLNLLTNAVKFTEVGDITLSAEQRGSHLVFNVADTGIGMTPAQVANLFQPFQQADSSTTRKYGGTGLGLAICKRIVELMGGEIGAMSQLGVGSSFEFWVPYVEAQSMEPNKTDIQPAASAKSLAGISILVVEDEPINQAFLEEVLVPEGARISLATNGREAVERVTQEGPAAYHVILMDVEMPEMDGYEATRQILKLAPNLPVIGQTAYALAEERAKCLEAGMVEHIAKPIESETLVQAVLRHTKK